MMPILGFIQYFALFYKLGLKGSPSLEFLTRNKTARPSWGSARRACNQQTI